MFDQFLIRKDSLENVYEDGRQIIVDASYHYITVIILIVMVLIIPVKYRNLKLMVKHQEILKKLRPVCGNTGTMMMKDMCMLQKKAV